MTITKDSYVVTIFLAYLVYKLEWFVDHTKAAREEAAIALNLGDAKSARLFLTIIHGWRISEDDEGRFEEALNYAWSRIGYTRDDVIDFMCQRAKSNDMEEARFLMNVLEYEEDYDNGEDDADRVQILPQDASV